MQIHHNVGRIKKICGRYNGATPLMKMTMTVKYTGEGVSLRAWKQPSYRSRKSQKPQGCSKHFDLTSVVFRDEAVVPACR